MRSIVLFLLLLIPNPAWGQIRLVGPSEVPANRLVRLRTEGVPAGAVLFYDVFPEEKADVQHCGDMVVFTGPPGEYTVKLRAVWQTQDKVLQGAETQWKGSIGKGIDPKPPDPKPPDPRPPDPIPPSPVPIPVEGLHVLIVYDDQAMTTLPQSQIDVLYSTELRAYLRSKGNNFRVWKKNTNPTGDTKVWQDAFARPRKSLPWIVVSNGKTGYEGPLPATVAEALALVKQYGGN